MKFMVDYPLLSDADDGAWIQPANIIRFAQTAEACGIDGFSLTDHPAPSNKWLTHGGHETLDPFVGLGFAAAVTRTLKLITFLIVVPYRNPFLTAKSMTAVDVLSGGRAIFTVGAGYLRSEFAALGVDFMERHELFDEAIEVVKGLWTTDELHFDGRHFKALGVTLKPAQVSQPHPPLWLGGNARIVREKVAKWGDGWAPLLGTAQLSRTARTSFIASAGELREHIQEIKVNMSTNGRDPHTLDIAAGTPDVPADASTQQQLDALGELVDMGVTWHRMQIPHDSFTGTLEALERYGSEVIAKMR